MSDGIIGTISLKNKKLIDDLMNNPSLMEVQETTKVTNQLRLGLVRILTDSMGNVTNDPQMLAQYRGIIKELDNAVFMLARLSQEDKHLDNEEMVAKALNEVTKQLRFNPYDRRAQDAKEMGIVAEEIVQPDLAKGGEFELVEGSDHIGLVETNYETFVNEVIPSLPSDNEDEEVVEEPKDKVQRDEPLAPPTPGTIQ